MQKELKMTRTLAALVGITLVTGVAACGDDGGGGVDQQTASYAMTEAMTAAGQAQGQIAGELTQLAGKARDVSFGIEDLRGGTFTISNLGAVGGTYSTPVINHPEVAILLLGRSRWMPVVRDGNVETRFMMPLSLSYDHRLVDGAAAARFLNQVIDYLETPGKLLITG